MVGGKEENPHFYRFSGKPYCPETQAYDGRRLNLLECESHLQQPFLKGTFPDPKGY